MNNSKRQSEQKSKAQSRAIAKRAQNELTSPIAVQQDYQVPEADAQLLASQTATWDTAAEIRILRFQLAKFAMMETNTATADIIVRLTKAIDNMIARNQATALRCGAYLSREAMGDLIRVILHISSEAIKDRVPDDLYEEIWDDMRTRLQPYFHPEAIAKANERYTT